MLNFYTLDIYKKLPIPLQDVFVSAKGYFFNKIKKGSKFYRLQEQLKYNEKLCLEELNLLQISKLNRILEYSYKYVPYYKSLFDKHMFKPSNLQSINDLKKLPFLNKQTIRQNLQKFSPVNHRKKFYFKGRTSGTSGSPLPIYMDREVIQSEHAFIWRQYRWAGCHLNSRIASFRGDIIVPVEQKKPPFWRYDAYSKEMHFSTYHLSDISTGLYLERINEFDPELIYGYPSSLFLLAKYAEKNQFNTYLPSLKGIVTSSETLYKHQKDIIEKVFGAKIFNWYGLFERVIFIGTCEYGKLHVFPDYGITEFIPVSESGDKKFYELVGTGFINKVMPLIRYRTGDIVELEEGKCECGRNFPMIKPDFLGRANDVIITPDGRIIGMVDGVFTNINNIRLAQIIQVQKDKLVILVEAESGYNIADEKMIISNMILRVGNQINVTVKKVDKLPRLPNNKYKLIVSKLMS